jgi:hypothetical protein
MAAIEVASGLAGEQLEATESAIRRHDRFEEQTHGQSPDQ